MLYLVQTSLPKQKQLGKALNIIYGIGSKSSQNVCHAFGIINTCNVNKLRRNHQKRFKVEFSEFFRPLGSDLKNFDKSRCQALIDIQSYKGRRHKFGYPVRGQRTHTNAKTQKKLHKRWLTFTYEKPKVYGKQTKLTKDSKTSKVKKSKTLVKPKPNKTNVQKAAKYKIS